MNTEQEIQEAGKYPLKPDHICFERGHAMHQLYVFHNHQSSFGDLQCTRCGFMQPFQWDYQSSNPMYYNKQ